MANMLCCGHKDPCSIHGAGLWGLLHTVDNVHSGKSPLRKRSSMVERLFAAQTVIGSNPIVSFFASLV